MKLNCDRLSDWFKNKARQSHERERLKFEAEKQWHPKFMIYVRLGHGDCRFFETVEARIKPLYFSHRADDYLWEWEYRSLMHKH